jgi:hypothetical protein
VSRDEHRASWWPALVEVLGMRLPEIDELTVGDFDAAVEYVARRVGDGK